VRVVVPKDLVDVIGRKEFWKSLKTDTRREALSRYFDARSKIEKQFDAARNGPPEMTEENARAWIRSRTY
jgi:hypothetical protein